MPILHTVLLCWAFGAILIAIIVIRTAMTPGNLQDKLLSIRQRLPTVSWGLRIYIVSELVFWFLLIVAVWPVLPIYHWLKRA